MCSSSRSLNSGHSSSGRKRSSPRAQVRAAVDTAGGPAADADLADLLRGRDTWTVE